MALHLRKKGLGQNPVCKYQQRLEGLAEHVTKIQRESLLGLAYQFSNAEIINVALDKNPNRIVSEVKIATSTANPTLFPEVTNKTSDEGFPSLPVSFACVHTDQLSCLWDSFSLRMCSHSASFINTFRKLFISSH